MRVEKVGGIDETEVAFSPGVTVLEGENATNRTSLLQGIMAALGSDDVSVKGDADGASVTLELNSETYTRELLREGSTIRTRGDLYLEDTTVADLFAFLLESNEARQSVVNQADLRELIMRPVDTGEIQREIDCLLEERRRIESELEELGSLKGRLPSLEERRTRLREEIAETKADLEAKEEEIRARDADVEEKAELEERLAELRSKRSELDDVRYDIETERESLESARAQKREAEAQLEELPEAPVGEIEELESERDTLRERKRRLETEVTEIQSVIGFNQEMLEDADGEVITALEDDPKDVTEELLPDETVTCWTCGSEVPEEQIETTVGRLQELSQSKLGEVDDLESRIDEVTAEIRDLRQQQWRREELQRGIDDAESEVEAGEATVERLVERREELQAEVEALESEIDDLEDDAYEEILDLHKEANQLEYDLGRLEADLESVEEEIAEVESRLDREGELEAQREELAEEIEDLRTRIDRIESTAVEEFNGHMGTVLDVLGYDNLARVWLERVEREVREGRRKVTKSTFELHVVRETESSATYEDTVDHLSESEREVIGLVFALAGYVVHDVHEDVPVMLVDSVEAIDGPRVAALLDYVGERVPYVVAALLPEHAAALPAGVDRVTTV